MRGVLILFGLGFVAMVTYFLFPEGPGWQPKTDIMKSSHSRSDKDEAQERPGDRMSIEEIEPDRIVGEDRIAVPDISAAALERLPPREPLSSTEKPGARAGTGKRLLFRPLAVAAGVVEAQGHRIRIAGIKPVPPEKKCQTQTGQDRPCGKQALTAFRSWLRGRAIDCDLTNQVQADEISASCDLAGKDVGAWLVRNGWAHAEEGSDYQALESAARDDGRGLFAVTR